MPKKLDVLAGIAENKNLEYVDRQKLDEPRVESYIPEDLDSHQFPENIDDNEYYNSNNGSDEDDSVDIAENDDMFLNKFAASKSNVDNGSNAEAQMEAERQAQAEAEEERRKAAEEEERCRAAEEAEREAAEEKRKAAEALAKKIEEDRRKAEEEANRKAEEEYQARMEAENKRKAREEAERKAAEEAERKAAEEAEREAAEAKAKEEAERAAVEQNAANDNKEEAVVRRKYRRAVTNKNLTKLSDDMSPSEIVRDHESLNADDIDLNCITECDELTEIDKKIIIRMIIMARDNIKFEDDLLDDEDVNIMWNRIAYHVRFLGLDNYNHDFTKTDKKIAKRIVYATMDNMAIENNLLDKEDIRTMWFKIINNFDAI